MAAEERVIRVFPVRTSHTPTDELAFIGDPPLWRPEADRVDVSCTFTWFRAEAERLAAAWEQHYPGRVRLGGPAFGSIPNGFTPGLYVRPGIVFTSRGCPKSCAWCLVPEREGVLTLYDPVPEGHVIADNNFLATPQGHRQRVYQMLSRQRRAAVFSGGLEAARVTDAVADELRGLRIDQVFLAADTDGALRPLERALRRLAPLGRQKLRVYVLCAYGGQTLAEAEARLERVWELGAMPFAMLYQPPDGFIAYGPEWRALQRAWTRPAAMVAAHRREDA